MCSKTMFTVNSLKCNFHFMPVYTFKLAAFQELRLLNLQGFMISVHMSSLQSNHTCELTAAKWF